jgi:DNA modification methylase
MEDITILYNLPATDVTIKNLQDSQLVNKWTGSALLEESTLHQISPYIGKMKSTMANALIKEFTNKGDTIYDPFCGSGTIALESWILGRNIIANDLSPYATTITKAKLFPITSIENAITEIEEVSSEVEILRKSIDLRRVPKWVRRFFHPETLRETVAWCEVLKHKQSDFLLACLLGILHHQRPGFLSFPSSHTVPYLREKSFPRDVYADLYAYRSVKDRLERKVKRALKRLPPSLNKNIDRSCYMLDAAKYKPEAEIQAIITSPPYMRQLDYGRDNRLRLWFLGSNDWKALDHDISPNETNFFSTFRRCLSLWKNILAVTGKCVLVVGDSYSRQYKMRLPEVIEKIATEEVGGYCLDHSYTDQIPNNRRVRRDCSGNQHETILILRCTKNNKLIINI